MYYNLGEIGKWESENSIYEAAIAAQYIKDLPKYKLDLDVVLALFHWGLIFRDNTLFKIVNNLDAKPLMDTNKFRKISSQRYEVVRETYLNGHYLYKGDLIRLESIEREELQEMTQQLNSNLAKTNRTIAFYNLDEIVLKKWEISDLKAVVDRVK